MGDAQTRLIPMASRIACKSTRCQAPVLPTLEVQRRNLRMQPRA